METGTPGGGVQPMPDTSDRAGDTPYDRVGAAAAGAAAAAATEHGGAFAAHALPQFEDMDLFESLLFSGQLADLVGEAAASSASSDLDDSDDDAAWTEDSDSESESAAYVNNINNNNNNNDSQDSGGAVDSAGAASPFQQPDLPPLSPPSSPSALDSGASALLPLEHNTDCVDDGDDGDESEGHSDASDQSDAGPDVDGAYDAEQQLLASRFMIESAQAWAWAQASPADVAAAVALADLDAEESGASDGSASEAYDDDDEGSEDGLDEELEEEEDEDEDEDEDEADNDDDESAIMFPIRRYPVRETHASGSALVEAVYAGDLDLVRHLLESGHNASAVTSIGDSALHAAVLEDRDDILQLLLLHNADVNYALPNCAWTPLHKAAARGSFKCLRLLLQFGADPARPKADGATCLDLACKNDRQHVIAYLQAHAQPGQRIPLQCMASLKLLAAASIRRQLQQTPGAMVDDLALPPTLKYYINHNKPYPERRFPLWSSDSDDSAQEEDGEGEVHVEETGVCRSDVELENRARIAESSRLGALASAAASRALSASRDFPAPPIISIATVALSVAYYAVARRFAY